MALAFRARRALTLSGRIPGPCTPSRYSVLSASSTARSARRGRRSSSRRWAGRTLANSHLRSTPRCSTGRGSSAPAVAWASSDSAAIGEGWCFVANGVSFLAVLASLLAMQRPAPSGRRRARLRPVLPHGRGLPVRRAHEGHPRAHAPARGRERHQGDAVRGADADLRRSDPARGAQGLGILMGASGIGALLGALVSPAGGGLRGLGRWVATACAGFGWRSGCSRCRGRSGSRRSCSCPSASRAVGADGGVEHARAVRWCRGRAPRAAGGPTR